MKVTYIPSQLDGQATTSAIPFRSSPVRLVWYDLRLLWTLKHNLINLLAPWTFGQDYSEMDLRDLRNIREICLQIILVIFPLGSLILGAFVWTLLPTWLFIIYTAAVWSWMAWISKLANCGDTLVHSMPVLKEADSFHGEKWVFINGLCTGRYWLQLNVDLISKIFHRPVVGIHNKTYGPIVDLLQCVIERCFGYCTLDTRTAYVELKAYLQEPSVQKVVVIAHSQGGIILSNVVDMLFADLPKNLMEKLEIYTFASAANHFNNPSYPTASLTGNRIHTHCIRHIEHYCNVNDLIANFGALHFTKEPHNRFSGKVFIRDGGGHLFNAHYLEKMFPVNGSVSQDAFLNQIVEVDDTMAAIREQLLLLQAQKSQYQSPSGKKYSIGSPPIPYPYPKRRAKTMRQVSRLWMYINGGNPHD